MENKAGMMTFKYGGLSHKKGHYKIVLDIEEVKNV